MNPASLSSVSSLRRWLSLAVLLLVVLGTASGLFLAGLWRRSQPPSEPESDPPLAELSSPFLNTRPGVKYVGDTACAGCHGKLCRGYHGQPMGRSAAAALPGDGLERLPALLQTDHLRLEARRQEGRLLHRVTYLDDAGKPLTGVPPVEAAIAFTLGSGNQGRAYVVVHNGYLYQSPLSWYSRIKKWDLSPGYDQRFLLFRRPLLPRCVSCHADGPVPIEGTGNRFQTPIVLRSIGCERCHGPGQLHVTARQQGGDLGEVDHTIVNPRHLPTALREAICQQCHLQGTVTVERRGRSLEAYRPGLPLSAFVSVFVKRPEWADDYKAVSHPEQMQVSRCFQASKGKLGCTSCHDPHHEPAPDQRVSYFRAACFQCHQESDCHLSLAKRRAKQRDDSCIACHMPQKAASDISHAAVTDHRILRRPDQRPTLPAGLLDQGNMPLVCFFGTKEPGADPELDRDLGVALMKVAKLLPDREDSKGIASGALHLLDSAVRRAPGDVSAWTARGMALGKLGRWQSALTSLEEALKRAPRNELVLKEAAAVAQSSNQPDLLLKYSQQLVALNPWEVDYRVFQAEAHYALNEWPAAAAAARKALELDPANSSARRVLIGCLVHQGDRKTAQAEFELLMALHPPNAEQLRRWYKNLGP
jgi:predicted CXXCH cytochrome family protein